ncbi:reverse transcriptase [Trichonephila clavipes]|nr:reverse transcriptase [Trichonephila clavipes]
MSTDVQHRNSRLACGTSYEETPTSSNNDSPCSYTVLLRATALTSKQIDLTNMTSNKADDIPEELKSCTLKTIEERYPANEWHHIYTDCSYLPETNQPARDDSVGHLSAHWLWKRTPPTTMFQTKIVELPSYGWTAALQWAPSHVGIPENEIADQKANQRDESIQLEAPLIRRRAKSIISAYTDKYTGMTPKNEELWKAIGNSDLCGPNLVAPGESRDCCPLLPNYRT